jgi:hypothetical protein
MRLQLSALGTRPMTRQHPAPFTPTNANNATPALNQRQGFTTEILENMIASSNASQGLIEKIKNSRPADKHKQLEKLIKTIEQAHYITTSLSDPIWLALDEFSSLLAMNNRDSLRRLGTASGLKTALRSFKQSRPRPTDEVITQLAERFYDLRNSLTSFVLAQQAEQKLNTYILKKGYGLWRPRFEIANAPVDL